MSETIKHPPSLYKYRPINKFTSDIFCRGVLWFSRPESFSDPYDCHPVIDMEIDKDGFRDHLSSTWSANHPEWSQEELAAAVERQVQQGYPLDEDEKNQFKEDYLERLRSIGVFPTCERADNVVMWSHYAENHRGICLEFDPSTMPQNIEFHKIKYRKKRQVINLFRDWKIANRLASGVKSLEWKYENEWRMVLEANEKTPSFPCEIDVPEGMITGVILGTRIEERDRERVIDWCHALSRRPTIYETTLDSHKFQINRWAIEQPGE